MDASKAEISSQCCLISSLIVQQRRSGSVIWRCSVPAELTASDLFTSSVAVWRAAAETRHRLPSAPLKAPWHFPPCAAALSPQVVLHQLISGKKKTLQWSDLPLSLSPTPQRCHMLWINPIRGAVWFVFTMFSTFLSRECGTHFRRCKESFIAFLLENQRLFLSTEVLAGVNLDESHTHVQAYTQTHTVLKRCPHVKENSSGKYWVEVTEQLVCRRNAGNVCWMPWMSAATVKYKDKI